MISKNCTLPRPLLEDVQTRLRTSGSAQHFRTRAALWAQQAPQAVEELKIKVHEDRQGRFVLAGSERVPLFVGHPPQWHENPTPARNPEGIWELNRHIHWPRLLRAEALGLRDDLAYHVLSEWANWIEQCAVPEWNDLPESIQSGFNSPTPWRSLEAGIRMESTWSDCLEALSDSPHLTPGRLARIVGSLYDHGRVLAAVPPRLWPRADHNHYLTENAGLLRLSLLLPELPEASAWRDHAWNELARCVEMQITPDGGQIEGCPHYHNVCTRTLAKLTLLGAKHGLRWPADLRTRLKRSLDYTLHSCRPDAHNVPWGDSDATASGPLLSALLMSMALEETSHIAVLHRLADPQDWKAAVAESLWDASDPDAWLKILESLQQPKTKTTLHNLPPLVHHQRQLDQVMLRTDWTCEASSVFFACHSPTNNGHAHLDCGSFDFYSSGRPLAVDPGRFTYNEGPDRYAFKCAAFHNTVTVDCQDPFAYVDSWSFGPQQPGNITSVSSGPGWRAAACIQQNFAPALHRRAIVLLDGTEERRFPGALVVVDYFENLRVNQTVQVWFHLDSTQVFINKIRVCAETMDEAEGSNLRIEGQSGLHLTSHPGRVSLLSDIAHPSTRLCFADNGGDASRIYVTHLLPRPSQAMGWPSITTIVKPQFEPRKNAFPDLEINDLNVTFPFSN